MAEFEKKTKRHYTSIFTCWQGWLSLAIWGIFDAGMYHFILNHREWASSTLGFAVDQNLLGTALAVGVSAIVVIRSKLAKVGTFEVGGEWAYLWSRAQVLDAVNKKRITKKTGWERRFKTAAEATKNVPMFFTDLEVYVKGLLQGRPDIKQTVTDQIVDLRKQYIPSGDQDPDSTINGNDRARRYLVSLALDYLGHRVLESWAKANKIAIDSGEDRKFAGLARWLGRLRGVTSD
jgi:hypothetical protein